MSKAAQICKLINAGWSNQEIAAEVDRTQSYGRSIRSQSGLNRGTGAGERWSKNEREFALDCYASGVTCRQIGTALGRSKNSVVGFLDRIRKKENAPAG